MKKLLLLFLCLFINCLQGYCQKDCELKISKDNIQVFTCKNSDSKIKSLKASFTVKTKPSVLAGHLLDAPDYVKWQYNIIHTDVVKKISENELIYHSEVKAPWPVSNRELVIRLKITQDPVSKVMIFETVSVEGFVPDNEEVVRVHHFHGKWIITPVGNQELKIDYSFEVDPGGSIPSWIINLAIAEGPYQTFKNLKARIQAGTPVEPASFIID